MNVFAKFLRGALLVMMALALTAPPASAAQQTEKIAKKERRAATNDRREQKKKQEKEKAEAAGRKKPEAVKEKISQTRHSVTINGRQIPYTATAGTLALKKEDGTPLASVFFIAYTKDDVEDAGRRPITFTFNGGPGSSSVWLHMGAFGPRRVQLDPEGSAPAPPYKLVNNEYSILDLTDLVFIDPVTTGYSRAAKGVDPKLFHGVEQDIRSVGDFIRLYTTRYDRWASPKLLAGESYGTTRAAGLSGYLQQRYGMYLNGIILVSSVLNFQTLAFDKGNDLPYIFFLPSYTATAWYHKKLPRDLQSRPLTALLEQARRFAEGDYATALMKGDRLSESEQNRIAAQLARYTGLSPDYIKQSNLRVRMQRFAKELLRSEGRTTGRYDSRMKGIDADSAGERPDYDPSYAAVQGIFSTLFKHYVRADLKFKTDLPYEILTGRVRPWSYDHYANKYVNVAETLRQAMTRNPSLRVMVANGYYDLATPFFATEYTIHHLGLAPSLRDHVTLDYYEAGHMMYTREADHRKLKADVAAFIRAAVPE